ncbi:MAG: undecaprenyl-diphosphate phosphatase [Candidatus Peribacteraceae bacterium]|nr:undecaprenyl-diphosphate phosphatase [Candidatus Peribacteraceae bacterium]MDD5742526.1 undecaprenyl-diphosphate phosphatase [Candidatus Peribacteraceae bacterium]
MTALDALLLGLLQGITELLPVSSSGHLVLAETFLNVGIPAHLQSFDILLHAGSLLALLLAYPMLWWNMLCSLSTKESRHRHLFFMILLATVPAAMTGLFFENFIALHLRSLTFVGVGFAITGVLLVLAERVPQHRDASRIPWLHALFIGLAQACALPPGVSRSGLTIAAARSLGWRRESAVEFSFLLAVPVIAGATLITATDLLHGITLPSPSVVWVGVLASFGSSVLAILFLRAMVRRFSLSWFALYLIPLAVLLLAS